VPAYPDLRRLDVLTGLEGGRNDLVAHVGERCPQLRIHDVILLQSDQPME
jgi:hypothetical protein